MNQLLNINSDSYFVESSADDLALVSAGRVRKELENNTNNALNMTSDKLKELELYLSVEKCQGLAFVSNTHYCQRCAQNVFNRNPIFKINGKSIKIGNSLKYLGGMLDSSLTWSIYIMSLHIKIYNLTNNFNKIIKRNCSVDINLIKTWYLTVIERALLYGAGVCGGALMVEQIKRLYTIQRVFC
ncbi:hypothetical protein AVEN_50567-1 [Araneus ventricosus]|uniref:Reverse transcriptase domain-containing protein n=1 Tax=Araneus ventricosus TaxID=182803 RepID=A0A4Y2AQF4_ARAVE|nr:hypothetical protein AVEN_50567-1 [Araneus ventricosus]